MQTRDVARVGSLGAGFRRSGTRCARRRGGCSWGSGAGLASRSPGFDQTSLSRGGGRKLPCSPTDDGRQQGAGYGKRLASNRQEGCVEIDRSCCWASGPRAPEPPLDPSRAFRQRSCGGSGTSRAFLKLAPKLATGRRLLGLGTMANCPAGAHMLGHSLGSSPILLPKPSLIAPNPAASASRHEGRFSRKTQEIRAFSPISRAALQAGGHRFDPGWLHRESACKWVGFSSPSRSTRALSSIEKRDCCPTAAQLLPNEGPEQALRAATSGQV